MNNILLLLGGYILVFFKQIPQMILSLIKPIFVSQITVTTDFQETYLKLSDYIFNLDKKHLNRSLEYRNDFIGGRQDTNKSLGYGIYMVRLGLLTYAIINKRMQESQSYEIKSILTMNIFGLLKNKKHSEIDSYIMSKSKNNLIKVFDSQYSFRMIEKKMIDNIFNPEINKVISHIDNWLKLKDIYIKNGITYKTGVLLYGEPGTGKSAMCRAVASYLGYDLHVINIQNYLEKPFELEDRFRRVSQKSVILLEEIDCVLGDRNAKDLDKLTKMTIGTLLNILDGVNSPSETVILATTNYIDRLDDAIKRSGRFDLLLEVKNINREYAEKMCKSYNSDIDLDKYTYPINPSYLQNEIFKNMNKNKS